MPSYASVLHKNNDKIKNYNLISTVLYQNF